MTRVWIIQVRKNTGEKMAIANYKGKLALVPVESEQVRQASCWSTFQGAELHLREQLKMTPDFRSLAPFEILQIDGEVV